MLHRIINIRYKYLIGKHYLIKPVIRATELMDRNIKQYYITYKTYCNLIQLNVDVIYTYYNIVWRAQHRDGYTTNRIAERYTAAVRNSVFH